ncbi:MAG: glutamate racemase [Parachlamydiaceae bacterium]|nr:glutamate racemase [Parachlamydiaceae bacterium]
MTHPRNLAIGMFDSGVGGLTVLRQICKRLPNEMIVYFGDTARVPYGDKSNQEILRYSIENAKYLMSYHKIKVLVNACNTSASCSRIELKQLCPIPVVDVIEAGVESIVKTTRSQRIAVLGTRATIRSGIYEKEIIKLLPQATVISIACPLFVLLVEEQFINHQATKLIVEEYLAPLKNQNIDALLLACTHYPLLRDIIQEELGSGVTIVDSSSSCADMVADLLSKKDLKTPLLSLRERHQFFVSDNPERFAVTAKNFLDIHTEVHVQIKSPD